MLRIAVRFRDHPHPAGTSQQSDANWNIDATNSSVSAMPSTTVSNKENTVYQFDNVYNSISRTEEIYEDVVYPIVKSVIEGYNGLIVAYGQTSSGKTYTMQGSAASATTVASKGIIDFAIDSIFEDIGNNNDREFEIWVSFMEIYNDDLFDLLDPDLNNKGKKVSIKENVKQGVYNNVKTMYVNSKEGLMGELRTAEIRRSVGNTGFNSKSSRSHSILQIKVESRDRDFANNKENVTNIKKKFATLTFLDLAGSEEIPLTANKLQRAESKNIRLSLLSLKKMIRALGSGTPFNQINFRDATLTRALQSNIDNSCIAIILCATPAQLKETRYTLQFGDLAKHIKTTPSMNEETTSSNRYNKNNNNNNNSNSVNSSLDNTTQYGKNGDISKVRGERGGPKKPPSWSAKNVSKRGNAMDKLEIERLETLVQSLEDENAKLRAAYDQEKGFPVEEIFDGNEDGIINCNNGYETHGISGPNANSFPTPSNVDAEDTDDNTNLSSNLSCISSINISGVSDASNLLQGGQESSLLPSSSANSASGFILSGHSSSNLSSLHESGEEKLASSTNSQGPKKDKKIFLCDRGSCTYKSDRLGNLKAHLANMHHEGVIWHTCNFCDNKFKQKGGLKQHINDKHNTTVWYSCNAVGCNFVTKQNSCLTRHKKTQHIHTL